MLICPILFYKRWIKGKAGQTGVLGGTNGSSNCPHPPDSTRLPLDIKLWLHTDTSKPQERKWQKQIPACKGAHGIIQGLLSSASSVVSSYLATDSLSPEILGKPGSGTMLSP